MKKKIIIISVVLVILIIIFSIFMYLKNQEEKRQELIKEIKTHYNSYIKISKNTKLYDKNQKEIGKVKKGFTFELEKKKINDTNDTYFKVKDKDYYVYYEDVVKDKKQKLDTSYERYLVFNKNIESKKEIIFYQNEKKVLEVQEKINLDIKYMDDNYYYVVYLNKLLQVKKDDKVIVKDHENTKEKESEYVSIINYENMNIDKLKEQFNYLKENKFYSITLEEYEKWLDEKIRLKEKAILLTTNTENENIDKLDKEFNLKIQVLKNTKLKFIDKNEKSTKEEKKDSISRYIVKDNTTMEDFKKMINGEKVEEKIVINTSKKVGVPVLNYHFFYDSSKGEACNENICLDVSVFRQQLDYLKQNGYKALTMEEFKNWMYGKIELPEKSVLITIDDGAMGTGKHNGNKLIPILEEYKMHATLFLIAGWWDVNNYRSSYLDIQSHTYNMHQYGSCGRGEVVCSTKEQVLDDLKKSLTIVDNNNSFCFPFYSYSDTSIEAVKEAGFKLAFIGGSRNATRNDDKYKIPRYPIHKTTTMQQFINMVS